MPEEKNNKIGTKKEERVMKKIIITLVVLILIAGASYGGYWYGTEKNKKVSDSNVTSQVGATTNNVEQCSSNQSNSLCLPGQSTISDAGVGLKDFRSNQYGIEFKYPSNYQISVSHSFWDPDIINISSPENDSVGRGSIKFSIKYNPTFADPMSEAKQSYQDCLTELNKNGGLGYGCFDTYKDWQKIVIDDKSYGYKTGIGGDPMLMVSFYAISSILGPKGSTFQFDAYLPSFNTSKATQENPIDKVAAQDPNVKKFLADFDQIIKSIKFFGN